MFHASRIYDVDSTSNFSTSLISENINDFAHKLNMGFKEVYNNRFSRDLHKIIEKSLKSVEENLNMIYNID